MKILELKKFYDEVISKIENNPETVIKFFNERWEKFTYEEKEVLKPVLTRYFEVCYRNESTPIETLMYFTEILVNIGLESEHLNRTLKLNFAEDVTDKQIAHIFYNLKRLQKITNTNDEIAAFLTNAFSINNKTALSYLNNPQTFQKVKPLL